MKSSKLLQSSLGTFVTRIGMSVAIFLGVFYLAVATDPMVLGVYSLFVAVIRVLDLLTNAGIVEAAEKRISEGTAQAELFTATLLTRVALFAPVALVVVAARGWIESYVGYDLVVPLLIAGAFGYLCRRTLEAGLVGEKKVARAGLLQFVFAVVKLVAWVVLVSLGYGLFGVLAGYVIGQAFAVGVGVALFTLRLERPSARHFRSLFRFAKYSWISAVTTQSWVWTDTLVLGAFVVPAFVGVYELSWQITGVLFLLASAISSTVFATASDLSAQGEFERVASLLERSLVYTGIIAIPGLVGGAIFAESLLAAFGEEYRAGAVVVAVLILARILHSYEVVFAKVTDALDRPDLTLRTNATFVVANVVLNVVAIATVGWVGAAVATAAAMVLKTGLAYHYIRSILDFTVPVREILLEALAALVMGACLLVLVPPSVTSLPLAELALLIGFGAIVYAAAVLLLVGRVRVATVRVFRELLVRTRVVSN